MQIHSVHMLPPLLFEAATVQGKKQSSPPSIGYESPYAELITYLLLIIN